MIIRCPECQTRFRLADEKVKPGGTKVRCARCRHIFTATPVGLPPTPPAPTPEEGVDFGAFNMQSIPDGDESSAPPATQSEPVMAGEGARAATVSPASQTTATPPLETDENFSSGHSSAQVTAEGQGGEASIPFRQTEEDATGGEFTFGQTEEDTAGGEFTFGQTEEDTTGGEFTFGQMEEDTTGGEFTFGQTEEDATGGEFPFGQMEEDATGGGFPFGQAEETTSGREFSFDREGASASGREFSFDEEPAVDGRFAFSFDEANSPPAGGEDDRLAKTEEGEISAFDFSNMNFGDDEPKEVPDPRFQAAATHPPEQSALGPVLEEKRAEIERPPLATPVPPRKSPFRAVLSAVVLLLLVLAGAAGYFFWQGGVPDIFTGLIARVSGDGPAQNEGQIRLTELNGSFVQNQEVGSLFVIRGTAVNDYRESRSSIAVKGVLYDGQGRQLMQQTVFSGNRLDEEALRTVPFTRIQESMNNQFGDSLSNLNVSPGKSIPFTIVFKNLPPDMAEFTVEIADSKPGSG